MDVYEAVVNEEFLLSMSAAAMLDIHNWPAHLDFMFGPSQSQEDIKKLL